MTSRKYWLDLFTGKTWEEFLKSGGRVSGFRERRRTLAKRIHPGDYLLCYLTGISRFIAILEVKSQSYFDRSPIWRDEDFPVRFEVQLVSKLEPETAVPVELLRDRLSIFGRLKSPNAWSGFFRGSPAEFNPRDGETITEEIRRAVANPVKRAYDERRYRRIPVGVKGRTSRVRVGRTVEIPPRPEGERASHEEIQWRLLKLGSDLGLEVWVARNDRNKVHGGRHFQDIPNLRSQLPRQFDPTTTRTIELIDVLWLQRDAIIAAFEVEHTSAVYSGLLRMSDLVSMQPNININLYIVAPDERREKVIEEINRPTFARLRPSLPRICKFISYSRLVSELEKAGPNVRYMRPEFIDGMAESCEAEGV